MDEAITDQRFAVIVPRHLLRDAARAIFEEANRIERQSRSGSLPSSERENEARARSEGLRDIATLCLRNAPAFADAPRVSALDTTLMPLLQLRLDAVMAAPPLALSDALKQWAKLATAVICDHNNRLGRRDG